MPINSRSKGRNGEYEAQRWLQKILKLDYLPERNLEQVRSGGYDLYAAPFLVEVKRCEVLEFRAWWKQITDAAALYTDVIPIVLFRQNRQPWRILISASNIGLESGFVLLDKPEAKRWLVTQYQKMLVGLESSDT